MMTMIGKPLTRCNLMKLFAVGCNCDPFNYQLRSTIMTDELKSLIEDAADLLDRNVMQRR
jgi:hypothetical protein